MKTILPWLCVVALLVGLGVEYASNRKQAADVAQLRGDKEELQNRLSAEQTKTTQAAAESEELLQLRKDHEDLLRLRNEVRQLRDEKQQLAKQAAQAAAHAQPAQTQQQVQQLMAENQQLRAQSQFIQATNQINICVTNLRLIETAKQQWAAANGKPAGALVNPQDLAALLPSKAMPTCPAGGVYTINPVGLSPICNIPGHQIPK